MVADQKIKGSYSCSHEGQENHLAGILLHAYRRFQFGPVENVGPNDFFCIEEVREAIAAYMRKFGRHIHRQMLFGGCSMALHWAAWMGDETLLDLLSPTTRDLDRPDANVRTPLSYAAENGHLGMVTKLLKVPFIAPHRQDEAGMSASHYAARNGYVEVVKLLGSSEVTNVSQNQQT